MAETEQGPAETSGLVALIGDAPHSWILVNALQARFGAFPVLVEDGESAEAFWARRRRLLGGATVLSQKAALLALKFTKPFARARLRELEREAGGFGPAAGVEVTRVASVNAPETVATLRELAPRAVFVCSTRMISKATLNAVDAPFVNYHSGLNPGYRGMYGGYHALAEGRPDHFGTTLHFIDAGVDTGGIVATDVIDVSRRDNFHTFVPLMAVRSRDMVCNGLARVLLGDTSVQGSDLASRQWFGPTLGGWLKAGFSRGVW